MPSRFSGALHDLEYLCQAVVLFAVVVSSIYNLTSVKDSNQPLWSSLLSVCVGLCVPGPALRRQEDSRNDFDSIDIAQQCKPRGVSDQCDLGLSSTAGQDDSADRRTI